MSGKNRFIIVESPTKAKKISTFLGKGWKVLATYGHVRDLPSDSMGFSIKDLLEGKIDLNFTITNPKVVSFLKKSIKDSDEVVIASDPDREGEAIAYHVASILRLREPKRAVFYEVTKEAILKSLTDLRRINMNLVHAQISRRIIDRLVGYTISPILWRLRKNSSAGRVQSAALNLISKRWNEVMSFEKKTYYVVFLDFGEFRAILRERNKDGGSKVKMFFKESEARELIQKIKDLEVARFRTGVESLSPRPPYITSSLLQDAKNILDFSSDFTMKIAQDLFESGYITYHRTDSVAISSEGFSLARSFFQRAGLSEIQNVGRTWRSRVTNAQESHECIRLTKEGLERFLKIFTSRPADSGKSLSPHDKLISLIGLRFLSSQSKNALYDVVEIELTSPQIEGNLFFGTKVRKLKFDGFLKLWSYLDEKETDDTFEGEPAYRRALSLEFERKITVREHSFPRLSYTKRYTQPPPLYTESSLIKDLERLGIGRPSTYATIVRILKIRGYIVEESGKLIPTPDGLFQNKILSERFPEICSPDFTANMEEELDRISRGEVNWVDSIRSSVRSYMEKFERFKVSVEREIDVLKEGFAERFVKTISAESKRRVGGTRRKTNIPRRHRRR